MKLSIDNGTVEDYHLVRLYYAWYAGWFYRHRLRIIADLLSDLEVETLLEVGTGSGILIPELLKHSRLVYAIDRHATYNGVRAMLEKEEIDLDRVRFQQGDAFDIPYDIHHFDVAVCVSVLEHFADPKPAIEEMARVVKPGGTLVFGFPAKSAVTNILFAMLGCKADEIHPADHHTILTAIKSVVSIEKVREFPMPLLPLYLACRASKRS